MKTQRFHPIKTMMVDAHKGATPKMTLRTNLGAADSHRYKKDLVEHGEKSNISITLTSSDSNRLGVVQNNLPRRITPRECARLQGFPDSFIVNQTDTFAYKQFGNSVSVPVIEAVISDFIEQNRVELGW